MKKVVYLSKSSLKYDTRVRYIASSIAKAGYESVVIAEKTYKGLKNCEQTDFAIKRILTFSGLYAKEPNSGKGSSKTRSSLLKRVIFHNGLRLWLTSLLNKVSWNVGALIRLIQEKPDLIISRDPTTLLVGFIGSRLMKVPLFYDSHEIWEGGALYLSASKISKLYWDIVERVLIHKVDCIFIPTESKAEFTRKKFNLTDISVLRNTMPYIDVKRTNILREEFRIADSTIILVYHGQISELRGVYDLVAAVEPVKNIALVFMGMGSDVYKLKEYITKNRMSDKIFFKEPVRPDMIISVISSADIGIQPYHYSMNLYYEITIKLLECLMAGLACIGVNFPEISKVIKENEIGLVFESGNISQLESSIRNLVDNPETLRLYKNNSVKAKERYSWEIDEKILISKISEKI